MWNNQVHRKAQAVCSEFRCAGIVSPLWSLPNFLLIPDPIRSSSTLSPLPFATLHTHLMMIFKIASSLPAFMPVAAFKSRKRPRPGSFANGNSEPKLLVSAPASKSRCLPHDCVKHSLTYLAESELLKARLVNRTWVAAVADCVECLLSSAGEHWRRCRRELEWGRWMPYTSKESRLLLCSVDHMTETFREEITSVSLFYPTVLRLVYRRLHACQSLKKLFVCCCLPCETVRFRGLETIPVLEEVHIRNEDIHNQNSTCAATLVSLSDTEKAIVSLKKLTLLNCYLSETEFHGLQTMPALEEVHFTGSPFSHSVGCLSACQSLKVLSLERCMYLNDAHLVGLELALNLEDLNLSHIELTTVTALSRCKALKRLRIEECSRLTDAGIQGLELLPTLEELYLNNATRITSVAHLSASKSLKKLSLCSCSLLAGIQGLQLIPTLEELYLNSTNVTSVSHSGVCKALKRLDLGFCRGLSDASIQGLERIPTLEELDLRTTNLTSVAKLAGCKSLKTLSLSFCDQLTDAGIQGLELIPTLEGLSLNGATRITSVSHLSASKSLKRLALWSCSNLSDVGIQGLELMPKLEDLILDSTNVTSVSHLGGCRALTSLSLQGCSRITDASIRGLERIPTLQAVCLRETKVRDVTQLRSANVRCFPGIGFY